MQGDSHRFLRADLHTDRCSRRNTKRKFVKNAKMTGAILFLLSAFLLSPPAQGAWIEMICGRNGIEPYIMSPPAQGAWIEISIKIKQLE